MKIQQIVRIILSLGLLYYVYGETGLATTLVLFLITIKFEIE